MTWTNATPGLLRPEEALRHFRLARLATHPSLSPWVDRYWSVRWSLPRGAGYRSAVLTHPAVHLTIEAGAGPRHGFALPAALLHGLVTQRFEVDLVGEGWVFGVKFRPGGFGAFARADVATWTDRVVPLSDVFAPADVADLAASVLAAPGDGARVDVLDAFLLARRPAPDGRYERLRTIVDDMLTDRDLTAVADVAARHGVEVRSLQRLFRRYVGAGPKWVLQRFRLHDAQVLLDSGWDGDLATLAATLGWFDQAHFARDFGDAVGVPPSVYAARR